MSLYLFFFNWRKVALQYCVGFCYTTMENSHNYTYIPFILSLHHIFKHKQKSQILSGKLLKSSKPGHKSVTLVFVYEENEKSIFYLNLIFFSSMALLGKNSLLWGVCVCVCVCVCVHSAAQSCPTLWSPMDCSPPSSSVCGIPEVKILGQIAISFSKRSSWWWDGTHFSCVSCTGRQILYQLHHLGSPGKLWDKDDK